MIETAAGSLAWTDIERDSKALADKLRATGEVFEGIVAITRGGLAPALMVAQILDIRRIETIGIRSYQDRRAGQPVLVKSACADVGRGKGWLVIDDLADTGETLAAVRILFPQARFAALYAKPRGKPQVDVYVTEVEQSLWLVFPWEKISLQP